MAIITSKPKILEFLKELKTKSKRETETIEVQMSLKGYDYQKDVRFDENITLPYLKRKNEKILILADKNLEEKASKLGLNFIKFEDLKELKDNKKKNQRRKLIEKYDSFISVPNFNSVCPLKFFNQKRKPVYVLRNPDDLSNFYDEVTRMVKFKLKKACSDISYPIGYSGMSEEELYSNYITGMNSLNNILKKGLKSLRRIVIKSTQGEPIKLL